MPVIDQEWYDYCYDNEDELFGCSIRGEFYDKAIGKTKAYLIPNHYFASHPNSFLPIPECTVEMRKSISLEEPIMSYNPSREGEKYSTIIDFSDPPILYYTYGNYEANQSSNWPKLCYVDRGQNNPPTDDQTGDTTPEPEETEDNTEPTPEPTPEPEDNTGLTPEPEDNTGLTPEPEETEPTDDPLAELNGKIKDILEDPYWTSEEKLERVKEVTRHWEKRQLLETRAKLKKEFAIEAAKEIAETVIIDKILAPVKAAKVAKTILGIGIDAGVDSIQKQLSSSNSNNEQINSLAEALYLNHDVLQDGTVSFDQAFSGQTFTFPFNLSQNSAEDQNSSPRFNALLNADIDFSRFSDSSDPDLYIDGTTTNYGIGLTVIPNPEVPLITGLQFGYTRSNSDLDYLESIEGTYDLRMFSIHPFIAWDASDSLTVWSAIGYGRPNTETTINSIVGLDFDSTEAEEEVSYSSSGDFFSFAGGANYRVWQSNLSALSIGLSGSTTSFLDNDSKEGSLSAQFSHKFPFDAGQLQTSADLALILSDSGPSATELSGQLNWLPNQGRLSGSTNARVLLFGGDRSEWGIGGSVTLLPGERGEGLSLALRPSFGQTNTALSNLHLDPFSFSDPTELAISTAPLTARFNAELAYGFPTGNHALLTPYTKLSMGHYGTTTSAGLRYQLDNSLDLDLSASHRTRSSGNNDNRFFLQLRSDL